MTGSSVVLSVGDPPRVVGYEDERVKEESHSVVEGLGSGESLVTTFVTENPDSSHNPTLNSPVQCPGSPFGSESSPSVEYFSIETESGVNEGSSVSESGNESEIPENVSERDEG